MKANKRCCLLIFVSSVLILPASAQSEISLKYIRDYVSQVKPKVGIVYSYDSIFLEATLSNLFEKGGVGKNMAVGLAVQTLASRKAFARFEALSTPAISKFRNFGNVAFVNTDDQLVRMNLDQQVANAMAVMKKEGVGLLVNVIFGGKYMLEKIQDGPEEKEALFLHGEVTYRFYVNPAPGLKYNYLESPVFKMSYQYGVDESQKDWDSEKVQAFLTVKYLPEYAKKLLEVKRVLETDDYFNPKPVGIVRTVDDDKRVKIQTNVRVYGEGGLTKTLTTLNEVSDGDYGLADANEYWQTSGPNSLSEGIIVASMKGDNKLTSFVVETGYQIPIAKLVAREGDMKEAICRVRSLPSGVDVKDLVGMPIITREQANWYFHNLRVPVSLNSADIDKERKVDESFLNSPPAVVSINQKVQDPTSIKDGDGIYWPMEFYQDSPQVVPPTTINNDPSGFSLDKVRSVKETVKTLSEKEFKIGVVYSPFMTKSQGTGIVRYFSDPEVEKFVKDYEKILQTSTGNSPQSKLTELGLRETEIHPVEGKYLTAGQQMVNLLNQKYNTKVFELIDGKKMPEGEAKLATKSKLIGTLSKMSEKTGGASLKVVSLSMTQFKLLGNYHVNINMDKKLIESSINLYHTGSVGLTSVGMAFRTNNPESPLPMKDSSPNDIYDKFLVSQKALLDAIGESLWESKPYDGPSFSYSDSDVLHPATEIDKNAKPNIVPKKEKNLLEKVKRYEAEGHKIGIVLAPQAIILEKEKPSASMNPALAADTVDCVFQSGGEPFPDPYLHLGKKMETVFNDQFETSIFQFVDADKFPKKAASGLMKLATSEPDGMNTQYKTLINLTLIGTYQIIKAGSSGITIGNSASKSNAEQGKYEMALTILGQLNATEYNNENGKDKKVFGKMTSFASDRFMTNECPTGIDDFVKTVGSLEDFFKDFEAKVDQDIDQVISKEKK